MNAKTTIEERLAKINAFLKSGKKTDAENIHQLRLSVKRIDAYLQLMRFESKFGAVLQLPERLDKIFHEVGELRKIDLETEAIHSITKNGIIDSPKRFMEYLSLVKKKTVNKLGEKPRSFAVFRVKDFVKFPSGLLSIHLLEQFLTARAVSVSDLLKQDIMADMRNLHQLRKILKSVLYVLPLYKEDIESVQRMLNSYEKIIKSVESNIGSLHDTDSFVRHLGKKQHKIHATEQQSMEQIKQEWLKEIANMKENVQQQLPAVQQFADELTNVTK